MARETFLSLDLDYWSEDYSDAGMIPMLETLVELDVPIHCVVYHNELTPIINNISGLKSLINVDYHSDFADLKPSQLTQANFSEGTWINYVNFASTGKFTWVYPSERCYSRYGICHTDYNPFSVRVNRVKNTCWADSRRRQGNKKVLKPAELDDIREIGISISPDWNTMSNNIDALKFLKKHKLIKKSIYADMMQLFAYDETDRTVQINMDKHMVDEHIFNELFS